MKLFFENFVDRFQNSYQSKNWSKNYSRKILFADSKTSATKIIHLKVQWQKILKNSSSNISCLSSPGSSYKHTYMHTYIHTYRYTYRNQRKSYIRGNHSLDGVATTTTISISQNSFPKNCLVVTV